MIDRASQNYPRGILDDAWQEGHCTGYRRARNKYIHPIYPKELAILGASIGAGIGIAIGLINIMQPLFT